jgi:signal transduction histidine kinase
LGGPNSSRLQFGYFFSNLTSINSVGIDAQLPETGSLPELRGATLITEKQTRFLNTDLIRQVENVSNSTLQHLTSLYELTHKILPAQSIIELAEIWLGELFKALPIENGAILLHNPSTNSLDLLTGRTRSGNATNIDSLSTSIIQHTFQQSVGILTRDATSDERFARMDSVILENIRSVMAAPISSGLRVWGVCYLDNRTRAAMFQSEDLEFLMATSREAGLVIENLKLIEELRMTQEQLVKSERLATIGKLTSAISHELRNRLSLLTGVEFIEMKYGDDPEVRQFTEMVLTGQQRALALVDEIRAFARNSSEQYEKVRQPIVPVIEKLLSLLRLDYGVTRRSLQFYHNAYPEVSINELKIEQVLINLVRNAVEATSENTGQIMVSLEVEKGDVVIRVADNGHGIPPNILETIWEPFFTTKGEEGTGLGLEICRRIIEAHDGQITCSSELGKGTVFTIYLPGEDTLLSG